MFASGSRLWADRGKTERAENNLKERGEWSAIEQPTLIIGI